MLRREINCTMYGVSAKSPVSVLLTCGKRVKPKNGIPVSHTWPIPKRLPNQREDNSELIIQKHTVIPMLLLPLFIRLPWHRRKPLANISSVKPVIGITENGEPVLNFILIEWPALKVWFRCHC